MSFPSSSSRFVHLLLPIVLTGLLLGLILSIRPIYAGESNRTIDGTQTIYQLSFLNTSQGTSTLFVQNPAPVSVTVHLDFVPVVGLPVSTTRDLAPHALLILPVEDIIGPFFWVGHVRLEADQAVESLVLTETHPGMMAERGQSISESGDTFYFAPLYFPPDNPQLYGMLYQNVDIQTITTTARLYGPDGLPYPNTYTDTLPQDSSATVLFYDNPNISALGLITATGQILGLIQNASGSARESHPLQNTAALTVTLPRLFKNWSDPFPDSDVGDHSSTFMIANTGAVSTTADVTFFSTDGNPIYNKLVPLAPRGHLLFDLSTFPYLPDGISALRVTASEPLIASEFPMAHHQRDWLASYDVPTDTHLNIPWLNLYSFLTLQNTTGITTVLHMDFYTPSGDLVSQADHTLPPWGWARLPSAGAGSASVTSTQPLAGWVDLLYPDPKFYYLPILHK